MEAEKGCAEATPAYRAAAALGEGFELAQTDLADCLFEMEGASPAETALFQQEGIFWLTRAAWAGEARAQKRLAEFLGVDDRYLNRKEALQWALVYEKNGQKALYGYQSISAPFLADLQSMLTATDIAEAEKFAEEFAVIQMAQYISRASTQRSRNPYIPPVRGDNRRRRR